MATQITGRVQEQIENIRGMDWDRYTSNDDDASSLSFFSGLILGLIVGAIVALFLAPQPGSNTREQVKQTGIELLPTGNGNEQDEVEI